LSAPASRVEWPDERILRQRPDGRGRRHQDPGQCPTIACRSANEACGDQRNEPPRSATCTANRGAPTPFSAGSPLAAVWSDGNASRRSPAPPIPPARRTSLLAGRCQDGFPGSPGVEAPRPQWPTTAQSVSTTCQSPPPPPPSEPPQLPASPLLELLEFESVAADGKLLAASVTHSLNASVVRLCSTRAAIVLPLTPIDSVR